MYGSCDSIFSKENSRNSFSAVKVRNGQVDSEFSTLVNPEMPIPFFASEVNGITDDMVADAPVFEVALKDFLDFIGDDVCIEVERLLLRRMPAESDDVDDRIDRAKLYVSLAERGCIDNSDAYAELARQELEIARAIDDDNFDHDETIDVIETYKRLHMQEAAEEIFDKARKLTDPAIEFIIQVEKIINE